MIDQLVMDLIERETRTKELSFWVSFDPVSLEELPSYDGPCPWTIMGGCTLAM